MAIPTEKSASINAMLNNMTGKNRIDTIVEDKCVTCSNDAKEFKDDLSKREYSISGMCQKCQDVMFGVEDE